MTWNAERENKLKELWPLGLSAGSIALELGGGLTKNAVIGKVHRLGLSGRPKTTAPRKPRKPRQARPERAKPAGRILASLNFRNPTCAAPTVTRLTNHGNRFDVVEVRTPSPRLAPEPIAPEGFPHRCGLLELTAQRCKWPVGDPAKPDFFFCGEQRADEVPYCAYHVRIAYTPLAARRWHRSAVS